MRMSQASEFEKCKEQYPTSGFFRTLSLSNGWDTDAARNGDHRSSTLTRVCHSLRANEWTERETVGQGALWWADVKLNTPVQVQRWLLWFWRLDLPVSAECQLLSTYPAECQRKWALLHFSWVTSEAGLIPYKRRHHCPLALDLKWDQLDSTAASQQGPETAHPALVQKAMMHTTEALDGVPSPKVSKATTRNL